MKSKIFNVMFYGFETIAAMSLLIDMIAHAVQEDYWGAVICLLFAMLTTILMVISFKADNLIKELDFKDQLIDELMEERRQKDGE